MNKEENSAYFKSADYYDRIYENHKNIDYNMAVDDFLFLYKDITGNDLTSIIDYGSGTGTQSLLFKNRGIDVVGCDLSEDIVNVARNKSKSEGKEIDFHVTSMTDFITDKQYDAGGAFFSPFNYLLTDEEVLKFLSSAEKNIKSGGLLFFEFWHSLAIKPGRIGYLKKEFDDGMRIYRMNNVDFDMDTSIVSMDMDHVIIKDNKLLTEFSEHHKLRSYTIPQIKSLINRSNWKLIEIFAGNYNRQKSERTPSREDFRLYPILQKV